MIKVLKSLKATKLYIGSLELSTNEKSCVF